MLQCVNLRPSAAPRPQRSRAIGVGYQGLGPSLGQIVIPWSLLCLLPRLVDSSESNQQCPVCGLLATTSFSKATWQPRGHPADPGLLRPAPCVPLLSALFEIELCFLLSTGDRGNGCFPFYLASAHPLSLAQPLSSVQNYLGRAPCGSSDDSWPGPQSKSVPAPRARPPEHQ